MYLMDDVRKWEAVYRLLDKVNTEVFDCGTLCGHACCTAHQSGEELGIYLLPGEQLLYDKLRKDSLSSDIPSPDDWLCWETEDPAELDFPDSWTEPVYFVKCKTPPRCPRNWRPLQCRTFPLKPVINDNGVLEMIWNDEELPYICPIIKNNMPIHDDFYKATYTVWSHLIRDPRIFDLLLMW